MYNKESMNNIDWNDANVLRNLSDGWYSVPPNSKYEKMIKDKPDIKYNDSVKKAKARHDVVLRKESEIDKFIKSETLSKIPCIHKNYEYKGNLICKFCGLLKKKF